MVWTALVIARIACPNPTAAAGDDPERHADQNGKEQGDAGQFEVARGPARDLGQERGALKRFVVAEILRSGAAVIVRAFGFRVQADHAVLVERAFQLSQSGQRGWGEGEAVEENGFVLRKEMEVVLQGDEVVLRNFGVSGVGILHIDRAVAKRFVTDAVIDPSHLLRGKTVALGERPPAVAALDELVRETKFQLRVRAQIT